LTASSSAVSSKPTRRDEGVEAVRRIIVGVAEAIRATKGRLQVIEEDQAPKSVSGNLPLTHNVEEWRDGTDLIPADWISSST
jgi:hypothetical protein